MSFLKSFLGAAFAQAARDSKKKQGELDAWNTLFDEAFDMSLAFSDYLTNLGINDSYVSPPASELATEGRSAVNAEKRKIENYKKKITEFINLGGHPSNIWYIDRVDDYISKLKYMISIGYLDQQDDWLQTDLDMLKTLLDMDVKVKKIMQKAAEEEEERKEREAFVESVGFDIDKLSGIEFENVCQELVEKMGFSTKTTKASGDGGIDLIAFNHQPLLSGKYIIQCKRYAGSVGEPIIRDLYGVVMSERANKGILMTTGHFTKSATGFAEGKPIELIDGIKLKELLSQYQLISNQANRMDLGEIMDMIEDDSLTLDEEIDSIAPLNEYYNFSSLEQRLLTNAHDYQARARMIDLLFQAFMRDDKMEFELQIPVDKYKRYIAQRIRQNIKWFYQFADETNIKVQSIKDCYLVYLAQVELLLGNFYHAYLLFEHALNTKTLKHKVQKCNQTDGDDWELTNEAIASIVMNMCQLLAFVELPEKAHIVASQYQSLLDRHLREAEEVYSSLPDNPVSRMTYEWYKDPTNPKAFMLLNYEDYLESDNLSDNLFDCGYRQGLVLIDAVMEDHLVIENIVVVNNNIYIAEGPPLNRDQIISNNKKQLSAV